jgi:hypothetical protein
MWKVVIQSLALAIINFAAGLYIGSDMKASKREISP